MQKKLGVAILSILVLLSSIGLLFSSNIVHVSSNGNINITAQKTWSNGEEAKEIDILLLENGKYKGKHQIANSQNNWQVAFNNLPKLDENKKEINYTVSEITSSLDTVQNNSITLNGKKYEVQITEKSKYNFVIDNKYVPEAPPAPKKKMLKLVK